MQALSSRASSVHCLTCRRILHRVCSFLTSLALLDPGSDSLVHTAVTRNTAQWSKRLKHLNYLKKKKKEERRLGMRWVCSSVVTRILYALLSIWLWFGPSSSRHTKHILLLPSGLWLTPLPWNLLAKPTAVVMLQGRAESGSGPHSPFAALLPRVALCSQDDGFLGNEWI